MKKIILSLSILVSISQAHAVTAESCFEIFNRITPKLEAQSREDSFGYYRAITQTGLNITRTKDEFENPNQFEPLLGIQTHPNFGIFLPEAEMNRLNESQPIVVVNYNLLTPELIRSPKNIQGRVLSIHNTNLPIERPWYVMDIMITRGRDTQVVEVPLADIKEIYYFNEKNTPEISELIRVKGLFEKDTADFFAYAHTKSYPGYTPLTSRARFVNTHEEIMNFAVANQSLVLSARSVERTDGVVAGRVIAREGRDHLIVRSIKNDGTYEDVSIPFMITMIKFNTADANKLEKPRDPADVSSRL